MVRKLEASFSNENERAEMNQSTIEDMFKRMEA